MSEPQEPAASAATPSPLLSSPAFDAPVFVTGLPRSGTSMVAGLLGLSGLWLGHTVPGGQENIRGFFENVILRERVQKEILRQGRFDPLGVQRLPPPTSCCRTCTRSSSGTTVARGPGCTRCNNRP